MFVKISFVLTNIFFVNLSSFYGGSGAASAYGRSPYSTGGGYSSLYGGGSGMSGATGGLGSGMLSSLTGGLSALTGGGTLGTGSGSGLGLLSSLGMLFG